MSPVAPSSEQAGWFWGSEADGWTVRAEPWRDDPTSLREVLTTVESWIGDTAAGTTNVILDGRSYTLVADCETGTA